MKRFFLGVLALALLAPAAVLAQTGHGVALTVTKATDDAGTSTYNIYSAKAACSTSPTLTLLVSLPVGTLTYFDAEGVGTYCYSATQVQNGAESAPTALLPETIKPNPPVGVAGKSQ